tara:strand:- start:8293 stop:9273 length:981 start_codon:yes stop_codon:yes gene_type:complete
MAIIIGGSGSSGSTMLIRKLSTHPDIFCGGETNFFNKEQLFENWNKNKLKIIPLLPFFSTKGWQIYRRSNLCQDEYGWTKKTVKELLKNSNSINEFTQVYFKRPIDKKNAKIWIEKTPSNAYSFTKFLDQYPDGKVIHIARNPLDSAASMYNKDPRVFYGVATWLYNNAAALAASKSNRYHLIKYEDLIYDQENTFEKLSNFIGIDQKGIVFEKKIKEKIIATWDNSPDAKISDSSMGRFKKLPIEIQNEIYTAFHHFRISDIHKTTKDIQYDSFDEICLQLGYDASLTPVESLKEKLRKDLQKDKFNRGIRFYETKGNYYPIELK